MTAKTPETKLSRELGLCAECAYAQAIQSAKGSQFLLCRLSQTDPHFQRYPRLPVLACAGYKAKATTNEAS